MIPSPTSRFRIKDKKKRKREDDYNKKVKRQVRSFFLDRAEVASDDEEEEEEYEEQEEILGEDELEAIERVNLRHEEARKRLNENAKTMAQEFENRYRYQARMESSLQRAAEGSVGVYSQKSVSQQSLIPSVRDPAIYSVRCKPGEERQLVRSILMKQFSAKLNGEALKLKSAFCTGAKGYIYVEALAEPLAREALNGLRGIFWSSKDGTPAFAKVPINQMTALLNVKVHKRPLKEGQFVRIKRGPLKGDLAKVVLVYEGSSKAVIQAVPRPDYTREKQTKLGAGSRIYEFLSSVF